MRHFKNYSLKPLQGNRCRCAAYWALLLSTLGSLRHTFVFWSISLVSCCTCSETAVWIRVPLGVTGGGGGEDQSICSGYLTMSFRVTTSLSWMFDACGAELTATCPLSKRKWLIRNGHARSWQTVSFTIALYLQGNKCIF